LKLLNVFLLIGIGKNDARQKLMRFMKWRLKRA